MPTRRISFLVAMIAVLSLAFVFQNCGNGAGSANSGSSSGTTASIDGSVLGYSLSSIDRIEFQHLGGFIMAGTPQPIISFRLDSTDSLINVAYLRDQSSSICRYKLGPAEYYAFLSALSTLTLGYDTSLSYIADAGDTHMRLFMTNDPTTAYDYIFMGGSSSHNGSVIVNGQVFEQAALTTISVGCNGDKAFQTVPFNGISTIKFLNIGQTLSPGQADQQLLINFDFNATTLVVIKMMLNPQTHTVVNQCQITIGNSDVAALYMNLRGAVLQPDTSGNVTDSGHYHLVITNKDNTSSDVIFQGGTTNGTDNVLFAQNLKAQLLNYVSNINCPNPF